MNIVGISCFYHDSAAALIQDGRIVAAAQEERFTRKKHDERFPAQAIAYCVREGNITESDIDLIAFYEKPIAKFDRILQSGVVFAPRSFSQFLKAIPLWLRHRLTMRNIIKKELPLFKGRIVFLAHHESHAASAFYPSPFEEAAVLTLDAVGEWNTTTFGVGKGNRLTLTHAINFPHSLGMLYSAFTYYTGFRVNSGEYKLMGLAPYGTPRYHDLIWNNLIDVKEDGSFRLNMDYFGFATSFIMTNSKFHDFFGGPPRTPESPLEERHMDIAASVQTVTEEIVLRIARHVVRATGFRKLVMAGGVALNCVANGRILREGIVDDLWIQPAAGDAGGALGAALYVWHELEGNPRKGEQDDAMRGAFLGPSFSRETIEVFLRREHIPYKTYTDDEACLATVAGLIAEGNVVGWFSGRMEFGPRALGARSIVGDPRNSEMQSTLNLKIKFRESFRPFAPSVLEEHAKEYFEGITKSPYMLLTFPVAPGKRTPVTSHAKGIALLKEARSEIPAVTHVDYSARVQTVSQKSNPRYYALLKAFYKKTKCPVLINTSFNVRGEPIVCTPEDAFRCFRNTYMDVLVLEHCVIQKKDLPPFTIVPPPGSSLD